VPGRFKLRLGIAACLVLLLTIGLARTSVNAGSRPDSPSFLYTEAERYEPLAWMRGEERFPVGASVLLRDAHGSRALVPGFAASADSSVSFDGQRVLFAGKAKPEDPWQIWEIALPDGEPRRVTAGNGDCIRPLYLPEDRVVYTRKIEGRFVIENVALEGGKPLALTYGPANFLPTDVLQDGRVLFEASQPMGKESGPEIYTVYPDGSGIESYRCDHGKARHEGRQVSSGDVVFVSGLGLAKFTSARAQAVEVSVPSGEYAGEVAETSSGDWLLPWRRDGKPPFQLMLWTPGATALRPAAVEKSANVVEPSFLGERAVPHRYPSGLHDWADANLLCLNAYTSKYQFTAGSIHSVRLYTRDSAGVATLLGTAPVERDGSFFVHVPADRPLQIELLDGAGKTLKRESGFFWMRRGEQRGCVGCHAGPEMAPENVVPMTLLKSTTPADMTGAVAQRAAGGH
jgi:hypothetical protein